MNAQVEQVLETDREGQVMLLLGHATGALLAGILQLPGGQIARAFCVAVGGMRCAASVAFQMRIGQRVRAITDGCVAPCIERAIGHIVDVDVVPDIMIAPLQQRIQSHYIRPILVGALQAKTKSNHYLRQLLALAAV